MSNEDPIIYDYYYSAEQESVCIRGAKWYEPKQKYYHKTFNGKTFKTKTLHGESHGCSFDDMVLVGTGDESQTEYK